MLEVRCSAFIFEMLADANSTPCRFEATPLYDRHGPHRGGDRSGDGDASRPAGAGLDEAVRVCAAASAEGRMDTPLHQRLSDGRRLVVLPVAGDARALSGAFGISRGDA